MLWLPMVSLTRGLTRRYSSNGSYKARVKRFRQYSYEMDHTFSIQPIGRFAGQSEPVKRPKVGSSHLIAFHLLLPRTITNTVLTATQEFACFSYDDEHQYHYGDRSLRWYYTPQLGADLSQGFETFVKHDDSVAEHLDSLLKTIMHHEHETKKKIDANVVTWRGVLTKVCPPSLFLPSICWLASGISG